MKIEKNKVVSLSYELKLDNGDIADTATQEQPFVFIQGIGQTLPDFDSGLNGLKEGDSFKFDIEAANAYGLSSDDFKVSVPKDVFAGSEENEVPDDLLTVGNMIPMQDNQGNHLNGIVLSVEEDTVKLDFNHPLADQNLHFSGKIISVREATEEELAHGHVHGEGGHHH
ncbi:MAG: peptidylprolyl isomerase [Bacteroidia bacterium]|nr:peptidylprolyl isomerase [Bacteroidia bacterium]